MQIDKVYKKIKDDEENKKLEEEKKAKQVTEEVSPPDEKNGNMKGSEMV
jgi:hypothetical protein